MPGVHDPMNNAAALARVVQGLQRELSDTENKIQLAPNLTYKISQRHQLGLAAIYNYHKNDLRLTRANENQQYNVYKLLGLAEYAGAITGAREHLG